MDVNIRYLGGKRFETSARGHLVLADQPFDDDGADSAMTPPELFLGALGSCAAYYAVEYLRARGLESEGLEIRVSGLKGDKPARIVSLELDIVAPNLTERHRDGILRAVNFCLIKNTMTTPPQIDVKLTTSVPTLEADLALAHN